MGEERVVGGYRLLRQLGSGGMGTVYEALDGDGRRVALKLLHPHIAADPSARARLRREAGLLHRVRDAGVARVLDAEVDGADAFVVTELIDGPTLEEDVGRDGAYSAEELSHLAHGLAEALSAIHGAGVVHRDLKPSNVMLSAHGPVLIDFGIAQVADDVRLTQTGMVTGTPGYLAPEIVEGGDPSVQADWWAWAAVLTFAATGRPPFGRGSTAVILGRVATGNVDVAGLPDAPAAALRAALAPDPARRPRPEDVLHVLDGGELPAGLATGADSATDGATQVVQSGSAGPVAYLPGSRGEPPTRALPTADGGAARTTALPGGAPAAGAGHGSSAEPWMPGPRQDRPVQPYSHPPYGGPTRSGDAPHDVAAPYGEGGPHGMAAPYGESGPPSPVPAWAIPPPRRPLLVGVAGLALSTVAVRWPGAFAVAAAATLLVLGTIGLAGRSRRASRFRYGPRRGDDARMYAALPWHLVRAVLGALPGIILGAVAAVVVYLVGAWVLVEGLLPGLTLTAVRWVAALMGLVFAWMPTRGAREGARSTIAAVLPGSGARAIAAVVLVVLAAVGLLPVALGGVPDPVWSPLPAPPGLF